MDEQSLRARVRRLVFAAPTLSAALLAGEYRSVFKGRGMDFEGLREYELSDDALRMDWNATARFGRPFVKTYRDDRDLTLYIVLDESASMNFGADRTKRDTAALAASLLAYACSLNGVRVGALFFGAAPASQGGLSGESRAGSSFEEFKPQRGERPALALMERIAGASAAAAHDSTTDGGSPLGEALERTAAVLKRRSLVLIVSDFMATGYALPLALLARRHDVAAIRVHDRLDRESPAVKFVMRAADSESGAPRLVAPGSASYKEDRASEAKASRLEWLVALEASRVPYIEMDSSTDPVKALVSFFGRRRFS